MSGEHDLSPREAVARIADFSRRASSRARWPGWLFLAVAVVDAALVMAMGSGNRAVSRTLSVVPALLVIAILAFAARQPVIGRHSGQINRPVLIAAIATNVAGLVVYQTVLPQHFTGGLVVLAIAMQAPLVAGAWLWLRR